MKGYIYFIINQVTLERYVGKTTNFTRRKNEHFEQLRNNNHINKKLQSSFNKYGEENFVIQKISYDDITKEELNEQEIYYINKYDSFYNGFNLTLGGDGGDTRSKLNFEDFCFAYFGNLKYDGMTNRTSKFLGVDSACIAAIKRKESYDIFRQQADNLQEEEKNKYLLKFEKEMNIKENKPWIKQKTLDDELTFQIMCVASTFGRGIEKTILDKFNLTKGFIFHLMTGNGRIEVKERYKETSKDEIQKIGREKFKEWELQSYTKIKIKECYTDLMVKYSS